jgi:hypothetical protein
MIFYGSTRLLPKKAISYALASPSSNVSALWQSVSENEANLVKGALISRESQTPQEIKDS